MATAVREIVGLADIFAGKVSQRDCVRRLNNRKTNSYGSDIDQGRSVRGPEAAMLPVVARLGGHLAFVELRPLNFASDGAITTRCPTDSSPPKRLLAKLSALSRQALETVTSTSSFL